MKQNNITTESSFLEILMDEMGDEHVSTSVETPMRKDAFQLSDEEKMKHDHWEQWYDGSGINNWWD